MYFAFVCGRDEVPLSKLDILRLQLNFMSKTA